jgi:hypothetical protein
MQPPMMKRRLTVTKPVHPVAITSSSTSILFIAEGWHLRPLLLELHTGAPPHTSLPATPTLNDGDNEDDAGAVPPDLSPASHRLV